MYQTATIPVTLVSTLRPRSLLAGHPPVFFAFVCAGARYIVPFYSPVPRLACDSDNLIRLCDIGTDAPCEVGIKLISVF